METVEDQYREYTIETVYWRRLEVTREVETAGSWHHNFCRNFFLIPRIVCVCVTMFLIAWHSMNTYCVCSPLWLQLCFGSLSGFGFSVHAEYLWL